MGSQSLHWRHYFIEAWGLGTFMIVAGTAAVLLVRAPEPLRGAMAAHPILGRLAFGSIMGLTVIAITYSRWGARSGAHLNPALTLAFAALGKIAPRDAFFYALAQFAGGALGFAAIAALLGRALVAPPVNGIVTRPGAQGPLVAFAAESAIAFILMIVVLTFSNAPPPISGFTGVAAGICVVAFIAFETPLSGMSLNPARTTASAFVVHDWTSVWVYFTAPIVGTLVAAALYVSLRGRGAVRCARLNHTGPFRCIFRCGYAFPTVPMPPSQRTAL